MLSMESRPAGHPQRNRMLTFGFVHDSARDILLTAHTSHCHSLKTKGLNVSDKGISVKTSKRYDHADYMETTRRYVLSQLFFTSSLAYLLLLTPSTSLRGLVNIASASSFGKAKDPASASASSHDLPSIERVSSDSSSIASQEKKKKGIFRSRK